ncbi:MAG TPA: rhodanese-like domain-containing protein [Verrucomicrobiae bacterium]|jgi:rhodanese-related sulfurtransferase
MRLIPALIVAALLGLRPGFTADDPKTPPAPHGEKPPLARKVRNVGVDEFEKLMAAGTNVVLDVRTAKEFEAGHIRGARNIDFNSPDFAKKVAELDTSKTYLVHCAAGVRSAKACNLMQQAAFSHLVNLEPGFKGWEKAGKAVEKK